VAKIAKFFTCTKLHGQNLPFFSLFCQKHNLMPVILSSLIILIAALGGWFLSYLFTRILFRPYSPKDVIGFRLHGMVPAMLPELAPQLMQLLKSGPLNEEKIAAKLEDPALLQLLKPDIESHVDEFLKVKLKEAFPLLSNFMGEKTLAKFKEAFLLEVESILPGLLKKHAGILLQQLQPETAVAGFVKEMEMAGIERMVRQAAARPIKLFQLAGFLAGAAIGLMQLLVIYLY
jgi:uncharacterized membrane protein YheB (UPF0754 family)